MKKIFISFLLLPLFAFAQDKSVFSILGTISGFPDGTNVSFFDRNTNSLDSVTVIKNNSFHIKGIHLNEPDFRFLVLNKQQPVIPILLDNNTITITGSKDSLDRLNITGSRVNDDYRRLSAAFAPFNEIFQKQNFTSENVERISEVCEKFVHQNPTSFVSLLAVSQMYQLSHNAVRAGRLIQLVDNSLMNTELARYLTQQINIEKSTSIGAHILPFTQNDPNGKPVSISDFKGKYVLIDFWASWCRPCRMENPNVVENFNRFKNKNFTVLGVSLDQSKEAWLNAVKMDHLTWTHVSDLRGWQNEVSSMFHITSIPANILIDPDGIIIAKNIRGPQLETTLKSLLEKNQGSDKR